MTSFIFCFKNSSGIELLELKHSLQLCIILASRSESNSLPVCGKSFMQSFKDVWCIEVHVAICLVFDFGLGGSCTVL